MSKSTTDSIFIAPNKLQTYLEKNNIFITNLDNGVNIVAATKEDSESVHASMNFNFGSGAYFDPPGKNGLHHLLEHLINMPIKEKAQSVDVHLNASTSFYELRQLSSGPVNPSVNDYGLLPFLSLVYKRLLNPLNDLHNLAEIVAMEKRVVQTEIDEYSANHNWHLNHLLSQDLLGPKNPLLTDIPGTAKSLAAITDEDLHELVPKVFNSSILTITIANEGKEKVTSKLIEEVKKLFSTFPQTKDAKRFNQWQLLDEVKKIEPSDVVFHKTPLKNGLTSLLFTWIVDIEEFTVSEFSLIRYISYINDKVFRYARKKGIVYYAGAHTKYGSSKRLSSIRFDLTNRTKKQLEELILILKKDLPSIIQLTPEELKTIVTIEKRRQETIPLTTDLRLNMILLGLHRYDRFIDADKVKDGYKQINSDHIQQWISYFSTHSPFITVVGDFA